jgi:protein-S-isoprenylcysteine O-methyltransferase Ste14
MTPGLQAAMNAVIVVLFTLLVMGSLHAYRSSGSPQAFGVLAINTLFLALFLTRKPARAETTSASLWLLGFAGSALPLLLRPTAAANQTSLGAFLELCGLVMLAAALLSLRRSFAVVPGNRGIRSGGMYRLVRHPVYLSELIALLGIVLANPTTVNALIWGCQCALQLARARAEERFLSADPLYTLYCARVRHRLVPWVV